jgi:hypothetical protein
LHVPHGARQVRATVSPTTGRVTPGPTASTYPVASWPRSTGNSVAKAGGAANLFLFRNDGTGKFLDRSTLIPASVRATGASAIAVTDVDDDGDEDVALVDGAGAPRLLRNDFGNSNLGQGAPPWKRAEQRLGIGAGELRGRDLQRVLPRPGDALVWGRI